MSGPWEAFAPQPPAPQERGPWEAFAQQQQPHTPDPTLPRSGMDIARLFFGTAGRMADNAARTLARGATLGFADELAATARSGSIGGLTPDLWGDYNAALAEERRRDADFDARNPMLSVAGQVAGGVAAPWRVLGGARSLPGAAVRGAATGAGYGALAGFGAGEGGVMPRAASAVEGALIGAGVGAAAPVAIAGTAAAGGALARAVSPAARRAEPERLLLRDLQRDMVDPADLVARAREAGEAPVALADIAGENTRGLAQVIARTPGEGQQLAREMLSARGGPQQAERLRQTIRQAISGDDFRTTMDELVQSRREAASENYARAYARSMPNDPRLTLFMSDPDVQRGVLEGMDSLRREALARGQPFDAQSYGFRVENGRIVLGDGPIPTQLIDAAKRGLDRLEEAARGPNGQATSQSREIAGVRRAMLAVADELNPDFAAARQAFAGDTALMSAAETGRRLATMRPADFEVTAAELRRMAPGEREFLRMGFARGLMDRINSASDGAEATRLRQIFQTPQIRERLAATFDNPEDYTRFARTMDQEIGIAQTNRAIDPRGGSPTMPMSARLQDVGAPPRAPLMEAVASGGGGVQVTPLVRNLLGLGGADYAAANLGAQLAAGRASARTERNMNAVARMLLTTNSPERVRAAENLLARALADQRAARLSQPIVRGVARGAGVLGGPLDLPSVQ